MREIIELFRELKRQGKNDVVVNNNGIFVANKLVFNDTVWKNIDDNIKKINGTVYTHFSNFKHNLQYFNKISEENWNMWAVVNQKCDQWGGFASLNMGLQNNWSYLLHECHFTMFDNCFDELLFQYIQQKHS